MFVNVFPHNSNIYSQFCIFSHLLAFSRKTQISQSVQTLKATPTRTPSKNQPTPQNFKQPEKKYLKISILKNYFKGNLEIVAKDYDSTPFALKSQTFLRKKEFQSKFQSK